MVFALVTGWVARHRIRATITAIPGLVAASAALVVVGVLGMVLNDSGVAIPAMVVVVAFTVVYGSGLRVTHGAAADADPPLPTPSRSSPTAQR